MGLKAILAVLLVLFLTNVSPIVITEFTLFSPVRGMVPVLSVAP